MGSIEDILTVYGIKVFTNLGGVKEGRERGEGEGGREGGR